jgi:hypothetical protein
VQDVDDLARNPLLTAHLPHPGRAPVNPRTAIVAALVVSLLAGPSALAAPSLVPTTTSQLPVVNDEICDPIDPAHCLLPFPNDFFTVDDPSMPSGRRVDLSPLAMPANAAQKPIDPTEWNRNDGFSPGSPVVLRVPGIDLHRTWGTTKLPERDRDHIADISRFRKKDAPIVILNTRTGKRHPFWSEVDSHPGTTDDRRTLILRPAINFEEGTRYVVAVRRPRDASGAEIAPSDAFVAYRDGTGPAVPSPAFEARRPAMERIFDDLARARPHPVARDGLYLAWDFTVASSENLAGRVLAMRDDAFAQLGDTDLGDGVVEGTSPRFAVEEVTDFDSGATARRIEGTVTVPNYLTGNVRVDLAAPEGLEPITDRLPADELPVTVPGSRLNTVGSPDGNPVQNPVQPTLDVPFVCNLPRTATADAPAHPMLYGHGLLGSRNEANGSSTEDMRLRGFAPCAVDWIGMATEDIANVVLILLDVSNFPSLPDRAQQGFLHFLYLGRALTHPEGMSQHPAFQDAEGSPLIAAGELFYDGNSQGGIMGGALTALAPDFDRAVLGVPGMNYSTLLNRSVDWEGAYGEVFYATYPDKLEQQIIFALMQMLWDRGESNGYAHHMTSSTYPSTPSHQVMLQVAFADHQVTNHAAEVMGRTIGADMGWPALLDGRHWSVDPLFGFRPAAYDVPGGSFLVYWESLDRGNATPPNGNLPATAGGDAHGDPRKDNAGSDQKAAFLLGGVLTDVCAGQPCTTTDATRAN